MDAEALAETRSRAIGTSQSAVAFKSIVYIDQKPYYYKDLSVLLKCSTSAVSNRVLRLRRRGIKITLESLRAAGRIVESVNHEP